MALATSWSSASRALREHLSLFEATPSVSICHSSPMKHMTDVMGFSIQSHLTITMEALGHRHPSAIRTAPDLAPFMQLG